jgi:hypothetical protein
MNPVEDFERALAVQRVATNAAQRTAGIWNSSWHRVSVFSDREIHEITVRRLASPTGLTDDTSDRICKDLKSDTIKGIDELLSKAKIKPAKVQPDAHVFLDAVGTDVRYSFMIGIFAKDDEQSAQILDTLRLHGVHEAK